MSLSFWIQLTFKLTTCGKDILTSYHCCQIENEIFLPTNPSASKNKIIYSHEVINHCLMLHRCAVQTILGVCVSNGLCLVSQQVKQLHCKKNHSHVN